MDAIDWSAAQRIGDLIAGSPPYGGIRAESVQPLAYDFARRVSEYSGLALPADLPTLEAVDRSGWIDANLRSMRPLLGLLTDRLGEGSGPLAGPLRSASSLLLGAQLGALTGVLSQRVLGQYDLSLLDASVPPRLLLLAPNLAQAARNLGVDREELVLWVTIHEITHAVQFGGAPWLRGHLGGLVRELIDGVDGSLAGRPSGPGLLGKLPEFSDLRELLERARRGEVLRLTLGDRRWQLVERLQATMTLIEGHAEHTMDAVGAEVLPSLPSLRKAMSRRRGDRGLAWRVLERVLGLELKLKQYEQGRRFCDAVVEAGGSAALARAWAGPEFLPTPAELQAPAAWLSRTAA